MALITDEVDPASTSPPRDGIPEGSRERQNSRTSMLYQYNKVFCLEDMALSAVARTSTNPEDAAEDQAEGQQTAVDMDGQVQSFKRRKTYDPQAKTTADGGR